MRVIYLIITLLFISEAFAKESSYPVAREDRVYEEMDSVFGGEGLVIHPNKVKNISTKTKDSPVNAYLWRASLEFLKDMPLVSTDINSGIIITDWYSDKNNSKASKKIMIKISDNVIAPDAIDAKVDRRELVKGNWVNVKSAAMEKTQIEDIILRRARDINIESKQGKK